MIQGRNEWRREVVRVPFKISIKDARLYPAAIVIDEPPAGGGELIIVREYSVNECRTRVRSGLHGCGGGAGSRGCNKQAFVGDPGNEPDCSLSRKRMRRRTTELHDYQPANLRITVTPFCVRYALKLDSSLTLPSVRARNY